MPRLDRWIALLFMVGVSAGCSGLTIKHDYDTNYDFAKLKTYDWMPTPPGSDKDNLVAKRIEEAVNSQLQSKGYSRSAESPDFLVSADVVRKTEQKGLVGVGASVGVPIGGHGGMSVGVGKSRPRVKKVGTLTLNIAESPARTLIWQGTVTAAVQESATPEEQQQRINQVVEQLLKNFPPGKKP
jgi:hypothetical protein